MNINLFDLEPEKIYGLKANEDFKQEKINRFCFNIPIGSVSVSGDENC